MLTRRFRENDKDRALRVVEKENQADALEVQLRTRHIKRLANNQCEAEQESSFWTH
ncbi:PhoU domain-containing protein [Suipraeoptans intestinalis]|uniref:PhoU domain-containing protein n=1 Tax=Suipraeoptans intestinalis TaxID=2606628 RepID=UPI001565B3C6